MGRGSGRGGTVHCCVLQLRRVIKFQRKIRSETFTISGIPCKWLWQWGGMCYCAYFSILFSLSSLTNTIFIFIFYISKHFLIYFTLNSFTGYLQFVLRLLWLIGFANCDTKPKTKTKAKPLPYPPPPLVRGPSSGLIRPLLDGATNKIDRLICCCCCCCCFCLLFTFHLAKMWIAFAFFVFVVVVTVVIVIVAAASHLAKHSLEIINFVFIHFEHKTRN